MNTIAKNAVIIIVVNILGKKYIMSIHRTLNKNGVKMTLDSLYKKKNKENIK